MSLERSLVCACAAPAASLPVAVQIRENVASFADSPSLDELCDEPSPDSGSVALQLVVSGHGADGTFSVRFHPARALGEKRRLCRYTLRSASRCIAASNASSDAGKSVRRTKARASWAPYSRSIPESSHSIESGPS